MAKPEQARILDIVTEEDVLRDRCLREGYYAQLLPSIIKGEPVWVRESFEPMKRVAYNLWNRGQYAGRVTAVTDDYYRAHAIGADGIGFGELSQGLLTLDEARALLYIHACQPEGS